MSKKWYQQAKTDARNERFTPVHAPNHIPGQKSITVGHEYGRVVYLPEDAEDQKAH
jgi:hypothetical protein